jgi:membrane protein implicated in regulation of membrane protease activity
LSPAAKRALGAFAILIFLLAYIVLVASFASVIGAWPVWIQAVFYAVAGIVWVFPLRPVFTWMGQPAPDRGPGPKSPNR